MKIWAIAWKDVIIRLRDRKGLMMLLMPVLLTAILGTALNGVISGGADSLPNMKLAVYNGDGGEFSDRLVHEVLQSDELQSRVTTVSMQSSEQVEQQVRDGKADAGIVIRPGFSEDILAGQKTAVELLMDPGNPTVSQIVRSIVTSYTDRVSAVSRASRQVIADLAQTVPTAQTSPADFGKMAQQTAAEITQSADSSNLQVTDQPIGSKPVSGQQYYAAAMAAMFLLFNATVGAKTILNERSTETLSRMMSSPTGKTSILFGKFLGTWIYSVIQFVLFMTATRLLFGISWGENWVQAVVVGTVYAIAVSGLSMTVAAVVATEQAADVIGGIGIQILAALGGSMVPIALFPDFLRTVAFVTPNTWALDSFLQIMTGTDWQTLLLPILVLMSIGIASLTIGTWRLRAR